VRKFFVSKENPSIIAGSDTHHIRDVLRMKTGDRLELFDDGGKLHTARIKSISKDAISLDILSSRDCENDMKVKITLAQALPKSQKMDWVIEKCTELGVNRIIPVLTERTIAKSAKLDRWRKIAKAAAEQSGRPTLPKITPLINFYDVLKLGSQFDLSLLAWEMEKKRSLKQILTAPPPLRFSNILITVGPEGGFSPEEARLAKEAGFISVSLGKRILRTETAGMAVLSILMYELEQ
jgi:16S rRNA (uracil1498-N3)-methyltransferase